MDANGSRPRPGPPPRPRPSNDWQVSKARFAPLAVVLIRNARRHPLRLALADEIRGPVSCLKALTGAIALARALRPHWSNQERVGVLLPPSVGGALVNMAAAVSGRVTVNLNYTTGRLGMEAAARHAALKTVITSRQFVKKADLELPEGVVIVWLEDLATTIGKLERTVSLLLAIAAPVRVIAWAAGANAHPTLDSVSTIIFSSGSTGEPKGVPLSHFNVLSNVQATEEVLGFGITDRLIHVLPFFHAFGNFMLWAGIHSGAALILIPNPLDAAAVGKMVEQYGGTMMCATPTFLEMYRKRISAEKFSTLRIVVAGGEKLPRKTGSAFERHFGKVVLEGYGCTECSPVIAVNAPGEGGNRKGSVGRPLPGVEVRVADPETFEPLPNGSPGLLMVRGPNVMRGYLERGVGGGDLTAGALRDGWYVTGDIASVDEDGFITITDRLARFSKIGGEMVPHGRIEEVLHSLIEEEAQVFAVTSVPDHKKGESLAVVHVCDEDQIQKVCDALAKQGMPNLFIPKPSNFIRVDELPLLGTGKIDLQAVKRLACDRLLGTAAGTGAGSWERRRRY